MTNFILAHKNKWKLVNKEATKVSLLIKEKTTYIIIIIKSHNYLIKDRTITNAGVTIRDREKLRTSIRYKYDSLVTPR